MEENSNILYSNYVAVLCIYAHSVILHSWIAESCDAKCLALLSIVK